MLWDAPRRPRVACGKRRGSPHTGRGSRSGEAGYADDAPRMLGFQAEGASPRGRGPRLREPGDGGERYPHRIARKQRGRSGRRARSPAAASRASPTRFWTLKGLLAREEASSASLLRRRGSPASSSSHARQEPEGTVVSVLTGHGLKDPDAVLSRVELPEPLPATFEAIAGRWRGSP